MAKIEAGVWEEGLGAVAARIREIEAKNAVTKALAAVPIDNKISVSDRHGIGGNAPPESIEDLGEIKEQAAKLSDGAATLREEVASENPNKMRVQGALNQLTKGLAGCIKWAGMKADLAVDTLIRWGIPAGGVYLLTNPTALQALIDAVLRWIPFL